MRTQGEMSTALLRNALSRGLGKADAVEVVKGVLAKHDLPAYSWAAEQACYDELHAALLVQPLAKIAKMLSTEAARVPAKPTAPKAATPTPPRVAPTPSCFACPGCNTPLSTTMKAGERVSTSCPKCRTAFVMKAVAKKANGNVITLVGKTARSRTFLVVGQRG
jgi:hypothetical protein